MVSGLFILHNIRNGEGVGGRDVGTIRTGDPRVPTRILGIRRALQLTPSIDLTILHARLVEQ